MRRFVVPLAILFVLVGTTTPATGDPARGSRSVAFTARIRQIPPVIRDRMIGSSWHEGCPVSLDRLRLVRLTYWGFDRTAHHGRLVVHRRLAAGIVQVFRSLYEARFPIRRMRLVDAYGADDTKSMDDDNTSAFNCRYRNGVCCTWSMHAYGKAVDIDPVENPYVGPWGVSPDAGAPFADRSRVRRGMLFHGDVAWKAFHAIGWPWGGDWTWPIDYQHFSSDGR